MTLDVTNSLKKDLCRAQVLCAPQRRLPLPVRLLALPVAAEGNLVAHFVALLLCDELMLIQISVEIVEPNLLCH